MLRSTYLLQCTYIMNYYFNIMSKSTQILCINYNILRLYVGLLEGDGNINIRRDKNSNQVLGLAYDFTFDKNNITWYEELKICLGFGNIYKKNDNTMRYVIFNTQGVIKLSNLINGNLRTPKINTFYKLIDILNLKYSLNIPKLPIDFSSFKFWRIG